MRNNKGIILSTYIYILLVFFLLLLATLLMVLNNTKLLSNRLKSSVNNLVKTEYSDFSIILIGSDRAYSIIGCDYEDDGYIAQTTGGKSVTAQVTTDIDSNTLGSYTYTYTVNYGGLTKSVTRYVTVIDSVYSYSYIGSYQVFEVPVDGYYHIELWGASGGDARVANSSLVEDTGGLGGYTAGTIYLTKGEVLYLFVGSAGEDQVSTSAYAYGVGGYNGGGDGGSEPSGESPPEAGAGGGGASDVRLVYGDWDDATSLASRIMVAAGGGGAASYIQTSNTQAYGADANGLYGATTNTYNIEATQTSGYLFGVGKDGYSATSSQNYGAYGGAGGGYYGGTWTTANTSTYIAYGGASGSSFISGYAGVNAITSESDTTATYNTIHYSDKYFIDSSMGVSSTYGNGSATITYISSEEPTRTNTSLNNVRYIKDCSTGNSSGDLYVSWREIQAIVNGVNVAYGKTVTGTVAYHNLRSPYSTITDGVVEENVWATTSTQDSTSRCVTVDLGQSYNVDEIAVWHAYSPTYAVTYYNNILSVSLDNSAWTTIISNTEPETNNGKRVNAWD